MREAPRLTATRALGSSVVTKTTRIAALIALFVLLSGCGGKTIAGGEQRKIAEPKYEASIEGVAVDRNGGVLVSWEDDDGAYERFAPPGKGWSRATTLVSGSRDSWGLDPSLAFNGRGERLAVWKDGMNLVLDVRRPGEERARMRTAVSLARDYAPEDVRVATSTGCGFLVAADGTRTKKNGDETTTSFAFLVRCAPRWEAIRVDSKEGFLYPEPVFDAHDGPALFWVGSPVSGYFETPDWERLVYVPIDANGHASSPRKVAQFRRSDLTSSIFAVPGAQRPTCAVITRKGIVWQVTPKGMVRLVKISGNERDVIADADGNIVVAWSAAELVGDVWISRVKGGRRVTEHVGTGSNPVIGRSGNRLFVGLQGWSDHQAIAYQEGPSWLSVDPGDGEGRFLAAAGVRGGLFWTQRNFAFMGESVESTDIYAWLYPHP